MQSHEYRVVPAPRRGQKAKGARTPEDRFARAVEAEMNRMATEGWEFVRSDTLPCERRQGWFSRPATVFETLLVFRRPLAEAAQAHRVAHMPPPVALTPPASVAPPPAPAASRFTPFPTAPMPANVAVPSATPTTAPTLTLVEPVPTPKAPPLGPAEATGEPESRHAAE